MTTLIIACIALAIAILALAIAVGASFKASDAERDLQSVADYVFPPSIDFARDLRRQDLAQ